MGDVISIPHFEQSSDGQCLPACARMVLAHIGINLSEPEIGRIIGAKDFGTPSFAIKRLSQLNLLVDYHEWTIPTVISSLQSDKPIVAFVRTGFLEYWQEDFAHAVVIVGVVQNRQFWIHDPGKSDGPNLVSWDGMLAAWGEFSYRGATVSPVKNN